jgi:DNA repair exonuclease SbcCD ATPase subunit
MAEHTISFKIGSYFKGEGFQKAAKTTKDLNSNVRQAAEITSTLAGSIGGLDTSAARAATAVSGLLAVIASGNAVMIAVNLAVMGISKIMEHLNRQQEEAKKRAQELREAQEKAFSDDLAAKVEKLQNRIKAIAGDFAVVAKQAQAMTAALNSLNSADDAGGIIALETEKLNAMLAAHTEVERQAIEKTYELKIATEKAAIAKAQGADKIAAAEQAFSQAITQQSIVADQLTQLEYARVELEKQRAELDASETKQRELLDAEISKLKAKELELKNRQIELQNQREILDVKLDEVKQQALNAEQQALNAIKALELKNLQAAEALEAKRQATEEAKLATAKNKETKEAQTVEIKSAIEIQREANAAARDLAAAQKEYEAKLKEYNSAENLTKRASQESVAGVKLKNGLLPVDVQKGIQMTVADQEVDDAIRNGTITTVKEADNLQRQAMREARDAISKNQRQQIAEAKRYERLKELNPKALASTDREFMAKYEKLLEHQRNQKEDLKKSKDKMEEAAKELKSIKTKMEQLGLK